MRLNYGTCQFQGRAEFGRSGGAALRDDATPFRDAKSATVTNRKGIASQK